MSKRASPHVISIIGARPQFVKVAPVDRALRECGLRSSILHTGQHSDFNMSEAFFRQLDIPKPDYNLGISGGRHGEQTGKMLTRIEQVLIRERPDLVLVFGDTNSTVSGALAAAKLHIAIGHVESGMRSFNMTMPEEVNRLVTDHLATLHFCATKTAVEHLRREGKVKHVYFTGDVMFDMLKEKILDATPPSHLPHFKKQTFILLTVHRAENTDDPHRVDQLCQMLSHIKDDIVFPIHPRTIKSFRKNGCWKTLRTMTNLHSIPPAGYLEMLWLEKNARLIMTDSGGVQKEAFFLRVPCITLRNETEWVETTASGWNVLTGLDEKKILKYIRHLKPPGNRPNPYGRGDASQKIAGIIARFLKS